MKIQVKEVYKSFGPKHILRGVDLDIPEGKSVVIIGGSGTGKSVLLKNILGLMQPDKGKILIDGQDIIKVRRRKRKELRDQFGMLFQGGALFDSLPIWKNVAFKVMQTTPINDEDAKELAVQNLLKVGLKSDIADLSPSELSGGMQKRVSLARAITSKPNVIFFDEPTTGLDPIMSDVINDLIRKTVSDLGATAVTITHDMASVHKISDIVAMLYQGKIIWQGSPNDLNHSGNEYVDQFVNGRAEGPIQMAVNR